MRPASSLPIGSLSKRLTRKGNRFASTFPAKPRACRSSMTGMVSGNGRMAPEPLSPKVSPGTPKRRTINGNATRPVRRWPPYSMQARTSALPGPRSPTSGRGRSQPASASLPFPCRRLQLSWKAPATNSIFPRSAHRPARSNSRSSPLQLPRSWQAGRPWKSPTHCSSCRAPARQASAEISIDIGEMREFARMMRPTTIFTGRQQSIILAVADAA